MRLVHLHARYGRREDWVLHDVNVELRPGDSIVVEGRNGSGKSTLLRVVAGLLPVGRGEVLGRPDVIGWLPERLPDGRPFTVEAYLRAMASVRGLAAADAWARIGTLAERLHFTPFLRSPLAAVSQGTRRKVGLTQALIGGPQLLVMDDPWEGLDAPSQAELPGLVGEVTSSGGICVLTDHRGRAGDLGPTRRWHVRDGVVDEDEEPVGVGAPPPCHVIEVAVRAVDASSAVASLRAAGYDVRSVRSEV